MKTIPIILSTGNSPEELNLTLRSLKATDVESNPIVLVDQSSSPKMKKYLYEDQKTKVKLEYDKEIAIQKVEDLLYSYINIPESEETRAIGGQHTVVALDKVASDPSSLLLAKINLAFTMYPLAPYCVILESGLMFNRDWFVELEKIAKNSSRVALASCYSVYGNQSRIEPSGSCLATTKEFYKQLVKAGLYTNISLSGEGTPCEKLQGFAKKLGMIVKTSEKSFIHPISSGFNYSNLFCKPVAWLN